MEVRERCVLCFTVMQSLPLKFGLTAVNVANSIAVNEVEVFMVRDQVETNQTASGKGSSNSG